MNLFKKTLPVTKTILSVLWEVGEITLEAFFNPRYAKKYGYTPYRRNSSFVAINRLKKGGLVTKRDKTFYLTDKGKKKAFYAHINKEILEFKTVEQKWDGKWRFVFFDVPELNKNRRNYLRFMLKTIGFKEFQKSVWAYPYKIPSFLKELLWEENIKPYTRFVTIEEIDYDGDLRRKFNMR